MSETQWYVEQSSTWGLCVRTRERQHEVMVAKGQPCKTEDGYVAYRLGSKKEAHLIAAAPELYEAAQQTLEWMDSLPAEIQNLMSEDISAALAVAYDDCRAALARARGEA